MAVAGWILDKSAAGRVGDASIHAQLDQLAGHLWICPVGELEQLYSTRSATEYDLLADELRARSSEPRHRPTSSNERSRSSTTSPITTGSASHLDPRPPDRGDRAPSRPRRRARRRRLRADRGGSTAHRPASGLSLSSACANICSYQGATILHADLDAFFASVEQRDDPRLRGRPVIVGAASCSPRATRRRRTASHSAMGGRAGAPAVPARDRRPAADVGVLGGEQGGLSRSSTTRRRVVEGLSIDEAFLDVRGLERIAGDAGRDRDPAPARGARARRPADHGRRRADEVPREGRERRREARRAARRPARSGELAFLHPLPVERLWGVGPVTAPEAARARDHDRRAGRAATGAGARRDARARRRPAAARARAQPRSAAACASAAGGGSIGSQRALGPPAAVAARRSTPTSSRSSSASRGRMRKADRVGRTVVLRLRFDDFTRATRSHTLPHPTARDRAHPRRGARPARSLEPSIERRGLTLVGSPSRTSRTTPRSNSPPARPRAGGALDTAMDEIRNRYGPRAVAGRCYSAARRA